MGLEIQTGKVPGTEIRRTPAPRPAFAGLMILGLLAMEVLFMSLVFWVVFTNDTLSAAHHDPAIEGAPLGNLFINEQVIVSFRLACTFFCLFAVILLYQRCFLDHVTIAKRRFRKWEDEGVQLR